MNGNPNKKQKDWHQWLRDNDCILTGGFSPDLHHIKGTKLKLKDCVSPGEWYCICVISEWHNYYGRPDAIHANRKMFEKFWNTTEKQLWIESVAIYENEHNEKPMSEEEYQIIKDRA